MTSPASPDRSASACSSANHSTVSSARTRVWNVSGLSVQLGPQGVSGDRQPAGDSLCRAGLTFLLTPGDPAASPPSQKPGYMLQLYEVYCEPQSHQAHKARGFIVCIAGRACPGCHRARQSISSTSRSDDDGQCRVRSSIRPGTRSWGSRQRCRRERVLPSGPRSSCRSFKGGEPRPGVAGAPGAGPTADSVSRRSAGSELAFLTNA